MSEISADISVKFNKEDISNTVYETLTKYDHEKSLKEGFERELKLFEKLGVDASEFFYDEMEGGEVSCVERQPDGSIIFNISGGILEAPEFLAGIVGLLGSVRPIELIVIVHNSQTDEFEINVFDGKKSNVYYTDCEGEYDELVLEAINKDNAMDAIRELNSSGKLTMPEEEQEFINGYNINLFEDEQLYDDKIAYYLKIGAVSGVALFLIGWLALGYFWVSLLGGILLAVFLTFRGSFALDNAKVEYEKQIEEAMQEDMDELGISEEQAASLIRSFDNVIERLDKDSKE